MKTSKTSSCIVNIHIGKFGYVMKFWFASVDGLGHTSAVQELKDFGREGKGIRLTFHNQKMHENTMYFMAASKIPCQKIP